MKWQLVGNIDGQDGKHGKDADPELVAALVREEIAKIPAAKDGASVTIDDVAPLVAEQVSKAVEALPKAKDGERVPIEQLVRMVDDAIAKAMSAIQMPKNGQDGEDGRDALEIDVLSYIDEAKCYRRGTFASHKGGLWRAIRTTDAMEGWECVVEGVVDLSFTQSPDDPRHFVINASLSSGKCHTSEFIVPSLVYKGIFREGERYEPGDTVTWAGSMFHCNESTTAKPETDKAWSLATKRGRDGKDGRDGIDMTKPVKLS